MKIAVIGPTYPFRGGIAHYTTLLVKHLRERHEVRFISYLKQYPKWLFPGNTALDPSSKSDVLQVQCDRVLEPLNPLSWWRTYQIIKKDRPDLLLLQWWTPFWSPMLFLLTRLIQRTASLADMHVLFICHHLIPPDGGVLDWFLARRILWRGDSFIVMSEEDFALLRRALPQARIKGTALPPFDVFNRTPMPSADARAKLNLAPDDEVLLFFGFIRRYKGLRYLLEALPHIRQSRPVKLIVAGEFWEDERPYRELVQQLGVQDAVQFYSNYIPNEEISLYFSAADVVVMPYLEATQSGIAQLAISFEKPMIATSVGGMPEAIHHNSTGLIVPPANSAALAEAVLQFFANDLAEPFAHAIRADKTSSSWQPLIALVEELTAMGRNDMSDPKAKSPRVL
ncbi:MAG: glycosyltransferase [Anaerolineae bacterium]|nr:glycosyltransferase [Anaerolineae bacterium]